MRRKSMCSSVLALAVLISSAPAHAASPQQNAKLLQGPPIHETVSPYDGGLNCLSLILTAEQKSTSFSVGQFNDRSNKFNAVAEAGVGAFSSQGTEEMLMTSLFKTGVVTTDFTPAWRQSTDWALGKMMMSKGGPNGPKLALIYPDVIISGGITSFDFMPGGGISGSVYGIGIGHKTSRILVGMDARAVLMIGAKLPGPGGKILAVDRSDKQIVGYEDSAGGSAFFGPPTSSTYVTLDFGHRPTEAIQMAERVMIDRLAFKLVSDVFNVTACNAQLEYGDTLTKLQSRTD